MALRVGGDHGSGERRAHLDGARGSPLTVDEENVIGSERDLAVDLTTSERLAVAVAVTAGAATAGAAWAAARPRARAATATAAWAVPWARAAGSFPKASSSHCSQQRRRPHCPSKVHGHAQQMSSLFGSDKELVPCQVTERGEERRADMWVMARCEGVQKTIVV